MTTPTQAKKKEPTQAPAHMLPPGNRVPSGSSQLSLRASAPALRADAPAHETECSHRTTQQQQRTRLRSLKAMVTAGQPVLLLGIRYGNHFRQRERGGATV